MTSQIKLDLGLADIMARKADYKLHHTCDTINKRYIIYNMHYFI